MASDVAPPFFNAPATVDLTLTRRTHVGGLAAFIRAPEAYLWKMRVDCNHV